jgi:hypothetical protein
VLGKNNVLFTEVLLPMLVVAHRAMLCTTTAPEGDSGGYGELFTVYDDEGVPAFKIYELASVCPSCHARGVKGRCKHNENRIPPHHSAERIAVIGKILAAVGRAGAHEREITGLSTRTTDKCFAPIAINQCFTTRYTPRPSVEFNFSIITVDPSSGGTQRITDHTSDFAIMSKYVTLDGELVLFGTTAWVCEQDDDFAEKLREHVRRLRRYPPTAQSQIVVVLECLSGLVHGAIVRTFLEMHDPNIVLLEEAELKIGVNPTNAIKREMMRSMRLALDRQMVRVDANFWSGSPGAEKDPSSDIQKIITQMRAFREIPGRSTDPVRPAPPSYSGKPNKDDLAIVAQLGLYYFFVVFMVSARYDRRRKGWVPISGNTR